MKLFLGNFFLEPHPIVSMLILIISIIIQSNKIKGSSTVKIYSHAQCAEA